MMFHMWFCPAVTTTFVNTKRRKLNNVKRHTMCVCVCVCLRRSPTIRPSDPPTIRVSYALFFLRSLKTGPWTQFVFSTFSRPDFIRPVCLLSGLFRCVFMTLIKPILFTLTAGTVLETFFLTDRSLIAEILQTHSRFN